MSGNVEFYSLSLLTVFTQKAKALFNSVINAFVCFNATFQRFEITMQSSTHCAICNVSLPNMESWKDHLQGRKHLRGVQLEEERRDAERRGIYVKGLFSFVFSVTYRPLGCNKDHGIGNCCCM
jgi:hypothetical protein